MDSFRVRSSETVDFNQLVCIMGRAGELAFIRAPQQQAWGSPKAPSGGAQPELHGRGQFPSWVFSVSLVSWFLNISFYFLLNILLSFLSTNSCKFHPSFFFFFLFHGSKNTEMVHFHFIIPHQVYCWQRQVLFRWPSHVYRMCTFQSYSSNRYS